MLSRLIPVCRAAVVALCALPAAGQTCEPHWAGDFWASAPPGEVRALCVHDDGSGQVLYMGTAGSSGNAIAVWDRTRLKLLGSVTGSLTTENSTGVYALAMFDDGSGPALHIAGNFTAVDGVAASCAARLTAAGWAPLGTGVDNLVRALAVFDDGSGPALYAGGLFQAAGGAPASAIARWDGEDWSPLGTGITGGTAVSIFSAFPIVYSLCVFDDGSGPALYAGGNFDHAGGSPAMTVARWTGTAWEPVGNGLAWLAGEQGAVLAMTAFNGPAGPSLYAAGRVNFGPQNNNPLVVRWDGIAWHPVATWIPSTYLTSLGVADFWGTPTLHVGTTESDVFRLEGGDWVPIGSAAGGPVRVLTAFNDGGGNHLFAGGGFTGMSGVVGPSSLSTSRIARWDSKHWWKLPGHASEGSAMKFKTLDLPGGPAVFAMGFMEVGGQAQPKVSRFGGGGWEHVGPVSGSASITDVEWYDDGTGAALYASGSIGVGPSSFANLARLAGLTWVAVGPPLTALAGIRELRVMDDGGGTRLFAGGSILGGIRAWNGVSWATLGGGLPIGVGTGTVHDMEVFDPGTGPRLYAAWNANLSSWTASGWEHLPAIGTFDRTRLAVGDDGTGPVLYAAAYQSVVGQPGLVARLDGATWTIVTQTVPGFLNDIIGFDDGGGPAMYVVGNFTQFAGIEARGIVRLRNGAWSAIGSGLSGPGSALGVSGGTGRSLWVAGDFSSAGGTSAAGIGRWIACADCYPDCNADGLLTVADFGCFQTKLVTGDPYADCTADGTLNVADFGCFQTRFVVGCP